MRWSLPLGRTTAARCSRTAVIAGLLACPGFLAAVPTLLLPSAAIAEDQPPPAAAEAPAAEAPAESPKPAEPPKKRHRPKRPAAEAAPKKAPEEAPAAAKTPAETAPAAAAAEPDPIVLQLGQAGVKTCLPAIAEMGKKTLPGVAGYARAANWQNQSPNERLASVVLGQAYPEGAPLPKAIAVLLGAPAGKKCDTYGVQVIPTKDKCTDLQTKILIRGKKVGELSGIPFLNDVNGSQVMLVPSAGDGCVLVALRINYAD
jgi:hypothetical protein